MKESEKKISSDGQSGDEVLGPLIERSKREREREREKEQKGTLDATERPLFHETQSRKV